MLVYKIDDELMDKTGDYTYMIKKVKEDYMNYFKASDYLQNRYDFCMEAIYSCLSVANNMDKKKQGVKMVSKFLKDLKKKTGFSLKIVSISNSIMVKEKIKSKYERIYF